MKASEFHDPETDRLRQVLAQAAFAGFSMAFLALPSPAMAEVLPATTPAPLVTGLRVHPKPNPDDDGSGNSDDGSAPGKDTSVPWYDPLEQRARDVNDGFRSFRHGVDTYTKDFNRRINDNPAGRIHDSGMLGDYKWTFDPMTLKADPYLTLRANDIGLGLKTEADFLRTTLSRTETVGDWSRTQGLRGDVLARYEYGKGTQLKIHGFSPDNLDNKVFASRVEGFQQWKHETPHGWKTSIDVNTGMAYDFLTQAPIAYARSVQHFDNMDIARPWLGDGSRVRVETEEGVQYNFHDGSTQPYYKIFGGAGKPIKFDFKGKSHVVEIEVGAKLEGNRDQHASLHPEVRARLHW